MSSIEPNLLNSTPEAKLQYTQNLYVRNSFFADDFDPILIGQKNQLRLQKPLLFFLLYQFFLVNQTQLQNQSFCQSYFLLPKKPQSHFVPLLPFASIVQIVLLQNFQFVPNVMTSKIPIEQRKNECNLFAELKPNNLSTIENVFLFLRDSNEKLLLHTKVQIAESDLIAQIVPNALD